MFSSMCLDRMLRPVRVFDVEALGCRLCSVIRRSPTNEELKSRSLGIVGLVFIVR